MRLWRGRRRYTLWLEERNAILTALYDGVTEATNDKRAEDYVKVLHVIDTCMIAKARLLANDRAFSLDGHIQESPMT